MAQNGREYLLNEWLPKIEDDHIWNIIVQGLLEQKDRHHLSKLHIYDRFEELSEAELDRNCYAWTLVGTEWLQQITIDILFATKLFDPDQWDPCVLQDYMNLMAFTLQLFQGQTKCLGKVQKRCEEFEEHDKPNRLKSVAAEFAIWRTLVNKSFGELVKYVGLNVRSNWDEHQGRLNLLEGDKIPGATFTELLIRNAIQIRQNEIVSRPMQVTQQNTCCAKNVLPGASTVICKYRCTLTNVILVSNI